MHDVHKKAPYFRSIEKGPTISRLGAVSITPFVCCGARFFVSRSQTQEILRSPVNSFCAWYECDNCTKVTLLLFISFSIYLCFSPSGALFFAWCPKPFCIDEGVLAFFSATKFQRFSLFIGRVLYFVFGFVKWSVWNQCAAQFMATRAFTQNAIYFDHEYQNGIHRKRLRFDKFEHRRRAHRWIQAL